MIYTVEKARLISEQFRKFTDSYAFMVAGQFANLDFWVEETKSALKAIDEHQLRFDRMYNTQKIWIEEKQVTIPDYCPLCDGICELGIQHYKKPELPKRKAKSEKTESRKELVNSAYYFLLRCYKIGLLDQETFNEYCEQIGTSIDPNDLK